MSHMSHISHMSHMSHIHMRTMLRCQSAPSPELSWPMRMRFMTPTLGSVRSKWSTVLRSKLFLLLLRRVTGVTASWPLLQGGGKGPEAEG